MAVKVFTLKKAVKCADCGKVLQEGEKVRGYLQQNGRWKVYCLKHEGGKSRNEPPPHHSTTGSPQAGSLQEVLERLKKVEEKVDRLLVLLEHNKKDS